MKINVTVDLSEFYTEDQENSFSEEIKSEIAARVRNQVWKDFESSAMHELKQMVHAEFEKTKGENVTSIVSRVIASKKIKKSDNNSELVTIEEYVTEKITKDYFSERQSAESIMRNLISNFESKFNSELKQNSETISRELRDRYDLLFASQIVTKLNENGMLKSDVARLLLGPENEG